MAFFAIREQYPQFGRQIDAGARTTNFTKGRYFNPEPQLKPPEYFRRPLNPTVHQLRVFDMNQAFRGGVQVHAVPDDERFVDSSGRVLPWGYAFPDESLNRKVPLERGPFGKTTSRRTLSRSKTATPATKEDILRLENQKYQDDIFNKYKAELAESQPRLITAPSQDHAAPRQTHDYGASTMPAAQPKKDTSAATFSEPTEVLIHGYLPSHLPAALTFYEVASFGAFFEDYDRAPLPSENPRYSSGLVNNAMTARAQTPRNLPTEALVKINTFRGGRHWIKITFESPLSAQRAMSASPHVIGGCEVYATPWTGVDPAEDAPIFAGRGGVAGTITGGARRAPPRRDQNPGERPFSSFPTRMHGSGTTGAAFADSTSSTEGAVSSSDATVSGEPAPPSPEASLRQRNVPAQPATGASDAPAPRRGRVKGARILVLRPAEEALLPVVPWSVRTFGHIPIIGSLVGAPAASAEEEPELVGNGFLGSTFPRTDAGEFDWARATLWWIICWYIDTWFGTDICGLKEDD